VTLVFTGNTVSGRDLRRHRLPVFHVASTVIDLQSMGHGMADRTVERSRRSVYFPVLNVTVMEMCCDALP
jgi:hypothetical protein